MTHYTIRAVNGDRIDFDLPNDNHELIFDLQTNFRTWLEIPLNGETMFMNVRNIVSITVKREVE